MRVTVDTNFLISATQWDYSVSYKLLLKFIEKKIEIYTTNEILEEFSKVLKRDFKYNTEEIINIMENVLSFVVLVIPQQKLDVVKEDVDDNKVLECAIASSSKYIITYDNHLLKLKEFREIKIIKPEELLKLI